MTPDSLMLSNSSEAGWDRPRRSAPLGSASCWDARGNPQENTAWSTRDALPGDPAATRPARRNPPPPPGRPRCSAGHSERRPRGDSSSSGLAAVAHGVPRTRGAGPSLPACVRGVCGGVPAVGARAVAPRPTHTPRYPRKTPGSGCVFKHTYVHNRDQ